MSTKKILIIDDEKDLVDVLSVRLKETGYEVINAFDGKEGLEKVKKTQPDLIILDVLMPVMGGFEFFKTVKKDTRISHIPILVFTARSGMKDTFEALDVDGFISKPVDLENLSKKVTFLLSNNAMILSEDAYVIGKVKQGFNKLGFEVYTASNEEDMIRKGQEGKYKVIVAHLPYVKKNPDDFLPLIKYLKHKNPAVILYCDSHVKGTEDNSIAAIDEIRFKWRESGADKFFDQRTTSATFQDVVKDWISL